MLTSSYAIHLRVLFIILVISILYKGAERKAPSNAAWRARCSIGHYATHTVILVIFLLEVVLLICIVQQRDANTIVERPILDKGAEQEGSSNAA